MYAKALEFKSDALSVAFDTLSNEEVLKELRNAN